MTFPKPAVQERRSTDACDQIDRGPAVVPEELAGRGDGLAERAGDLVREADRAREGEWHVALRAGEGSHAKPGGPLGGTDLHPRGRGAQALVALGIEVAGRIVKKPHDLIIALCAGGPSGGGRARCKFHPVWMEEG